MKYLLKKKMKKKVQIWIRKISKFKKKEKICVNLICVKIKMNNGAILNKSVQFWNSVTSRVRFWINYSVSAILKHTSGCNILVKCEISAILWMV